MPFSINESSDDSFILTANQPYHLNPGPISLGQQTNVTAFTASQFTGVSFYALDQTNQQLFQNGQSFSGILINPTGQTGLGNITLPAGEWWIGAKYTGSLT